MFIVPLKVGSTLVTLPLNVTPYRDGVNGARDRVTCQKLVTTSRYGLVPCGVGIWLSHQRDDTVRAGASVDVQRHAERPHLLRPDMKMDLQEVGWGGMGWNELVQDRERWPVMNIRVP